MNNHTTDFITYEMKRLEDERLDELGVEETDEDWSKKTLDEQLSIIANHPLMLREIKKENLDFGAITCTARKPKCSVCPISKQCNWLKYIPDANK